MKRSWRIESHRRRPFALPSADGKARYLRRGFGEIAPCYDRYNDLLTQGQHRRWKRRLIDGLELQRPRLCVLDLCCGSGDLALGLWKRMRADQSLLGADFSAPMLSRARERLQRAEARTKRHAKPKQATPERPQWMLIETDALRLPLADASLDAVSIGYGLRNVTDLPQLLRELWRVLRPEGQLACLDTGQVRAAWLRPLVRFYTHQLASRLGKWLQPGQDLFDYLPRSMDSFLHQDELCALLLRHGFQPPLHGRMCIEFLGGSSIVLFARKPGAERMSPSAGDACAVPSAEFSSGPDHQAQSRAATKATDHARRSQRP